MCADTIETGPIGGGAPRAGKPDAAPSGGAPSGTSVMVRVMGMPCLVHVIDHEGPRGPEGRAVGALGAP